MATRLYVTLKDDSLITTMLGISETAQSDWDAIDERFAQVDPDETDMESDARGYRRYKAMHDDPNTSTLENFYLYGWGRLQCNVETLGFHQGDDSTADKALIFRILKRQLAYLLDANELDDPLPHSLFWAIANTDEIEYISWY